MDNIIEPNESFDFLKLSLAHPTGIQGGAYFTKILNNNKPLYIQTTKSLTRQGFVKTGKKYYCDLMFDNNSETLINWFENLEDKCKKLIYERADTWFQNALEMNDVDSAFNSIIRIYKSGKYYLVRTSVKNTISNEPSVKIYNENEIPLGINDVTSETNIISILEIQGIKFTSRNFQIEIELKQVMVLNNEPIFDNCLIKTKKIDNKEKQDSPKIENTEIQNPVNNTNTIPNAKHLVINDDESKLEEVELNLDTITSNTDLNNDTDNYIDYADDLNNDSNNNSIINVSTISFNNDKSNNVKNTLDCLETKMDEIESNVEDSKYSNDSNDLMIDIEDLNVEDLNVEDSKELTEIKLDVGLENNLEAITLKKPNQVYFELYKEARNKAKIAKKSAIIAYLEAKNIRKTYMISTLNDSDSDFDAEIEDVSESELEGL
jgi:hypothetical protein